MHKYIYWMVVLGVGLGLVSHALQAEDTKTLQTKEDKISYGIGVDIGKNFKRLGLTVDLGTLAQGLSAAYSDKPLSISEAELSQIMATYQTEMRQKQATVYHELASNNQKAGDAFLAENAKKTGVIKLPSGLQYKVITPGNGKKPNVDSIVACHYRGTLIDGKEFDNSISSGKPALFKLDGVIPGWQEALKLMPEGSKWQLFIPPQLAYGAQGAGRDIGPNATLVFDIELVNVKPAAKS